MLEAGQSRQHCLPQPLHNDRYGRFCLLTLVCSLETGQMTTREKRQFTPVYSDQPGVQELLRVEAFPVCFLEENLNLKVAVRHSFAVKSLNSDVGNVWFDFNLMLFFLFCYSVTIIHTFPWNSTTPKPLLALQTARQTHTIRVIFSNYSITH